MVKRKRRRLWCVWVLGGLAAARVAAVTPEMHTGLLRPRPARGGVFAVADHTPPNVIQTDLPPVAGRYSGAVFLEPVPGQVVPLRRSHRPVSMPPVNGTVCCTGRTLASGCLQGQRIEDERGHAASSSALDVTVDITDLGIFAADLGRELEPYLLEGEHIALVNLRHRQCFNTGGAQLQHRTALPFV